MKKKIEKISLNGWLNIDKPLGVTSTQIVNRIKYILRPKKIGHAGTLDPMASGILPIALGEATKTIHYYQDARKTYQFTIRFGATTDTLDAEGKIINRTDKLPTLSEIENLLPSFTGKIKQTPPAYSAIKIDGERAYDLARRGEEFEIKEREIEIYSLKIVNFDKNQYLNDLTLECECSKGTYIRSLGKDIAEKAGSLGYITFLRRTGYGIFSPETAFSLKSQENSDEDLLLMKNSLIASLKPIDIVLADIPVLYPDMTACNKLSSGLKIPMNDKDGIYRVYNEEKKFIAIADLHNGLLSPKRVFN